MAILYDAKSTSGEQTTDNSYSWNHTVGSDDNRLLVVGVLIRDGTEGMGISSLTFNGDSLTESAVKKVTTDNKLNCRLFYMVAPDEGTHSITVTFNDTVDSSNCSAVSFSGVAQTSTVIDSSTSTADGTPTVDVTPTEAGQMVVDIMISNYNSAHTVGADQTEVYNLSFSSGTDHGGMSYETSISSSDVTMSWSGSADYAEAATCFSEAAVFPADYTLLGKYKVANAKVSGSADLTNQPVLLLDADFISSVFDNCDNGGGDLRFSSDAAGSTQLSCEVVSFNTSTDKAQVWVKTTLDHDDDTYLYIWGDNTGDSQPAIDASYGAESVWGADYKGVWHLESDGTDSTTNDNDLTDYATPTYTTGKFGNCVDLEFDSSQYLSIAHASQTGLDMTGNRVLLAVVNSESTTAGVRKILNKNSDLNSYRGYGLMQYTTGWKARAEVTNLTTGGAVNSSNDANTGEWALVAMRYNGSAIDTWLNSTKSTSAASGTSIDSGTPFDIGCDHGPSGTTPTNFYDGKIDEGWVISGTRTDDWVTTMYNMLLDHSNFGEGESIIVEEDVSVYDETTVTESVTLYRSNEDIYAYDTTVSVTDSTTVSVPLLHISANESSSISDAAIITTSALLINTYDATNITDSTNVHIPILNVIVNDESTVTDADSMGTPYTTPTASAKARGSIIPSQLFIDEVNKTVRQMQNKLEILWDGVSWSDESTYFMSAKGNEKMGNESGEGVSATLDVDLDNATNRFTPDYTASPIYAYIKPRVKIRISITMGGYSYTLFTGYVKNIHPNLKSGTCSLECYDNQVSVSNKETNGVVYDNYRSDQLLEVLSGLAGMTSDEWEFDEGSLIINYGYFDSRNVWPLMGEIASAERGRIFFDRDGKLKFWNRDRLHNRTSYITLTREDWITNLDYSVAEHQVKNSVTVQAMPRAAAGIQVVWTNGNIEYLDPYSDTLVYIPAGSTQIAFLELEDPCATFITPIPNTDYTANSALNGTGDDLTSDIIIANIIEYGNAVNITVSNTGVTDAYLTKFQLRGNPVRVLNYIRMKATDSPSIAYYGEQTIEIQNDFVQNEDAALQIAYEELGRRQDAINNFDIEMIGIPYLLCSDILYVEYGDGTYKNYMVSSLDWTLDDGGFTQKLRMVNPYIFPPIARVDARANITTTKTITATSKASVA